MKLKEVMTALKARGSDPIRRILMKHGALASLLGVRIGDMKPIARQIKGDEEAQDDAVLTGQLPTGRPPAAIGRGTRARARRG